MLGRLNEALRHAETVRLDTGRNAIQLGTIKTTDGWQAASSDDILSAGKTPVPVALVLYAMSCIVSVSDRHRERAAICCAELKGQVSDGHVGESSGVISWKWPPVQTVPSFTKPAAVLSGSKFPPQPKAPTRPPEQILHSENGMPAEEEVMKSSHFLVGSYVENWQRRNGTAVFCPGLHSVSRFFAALELSMPREPDDTVEEKG